MAGGPHLSALDNSQKRMQRVASDDCELGEKQEGKQAQACRSGVVKLAGAGYHRKSRLALPAELGWRSRTNGLRESECQTLQ